MSAVFHQPAWSCGLHGSTPDVDRLWVPVLERHHTALVLNGHDHDYERFAPQTPQGLADEARGMREFVVGTGGRNLTRFVSEQPNSEARSDATFGILRLRLRPDTYEWEFVPIAGQTFADRGLGVCH